MSYVAQVVVYLLAVLGTFFKAVREDSDGKVLRSRIGLPIPTRVGYSILTLTTLSFAVSLFVNWRSDRNAKHAEDELRSQLAASSMRERDLQMRLISVDELDHVLFGSQLDSVFPPEVFLGETEFVRKMFCTPPYPVRFASLRINLTRVPELELIFRIDSIESGTCAVNVHLRHDWSGKEAPASYLLPMTMGRKFVLHGTVGKEFLSEMQLPQALTMYSFTVPASAEFNVAPQDTSLAEEIYAYYNHRLPRDLGIQVSFDPQQPELAITRRMRRQDKMVRSPSGYATFYYRQTPDTSAWNRTAFLDGRN